MNETELRQLFKNASDCYADTRTGTETIEGEVVQAMTEDGFIAALRQAKLLLPEPAEHTCMYSRGLNQPRPRLCVFCGRPEPNNQQQ